MKGYDISSYCMDYTGVRMSIISWNEVLAELIRVATDQEPSVLGDLSQLKGELAAIRKIDFKQYQKKVKSVINLDLVILDDFFCTLSRRMMKSRLYMMSWKNGMNCQGAVLSAHSVSQRHGHLC